MRLIERRRISSRVIRSVFLLSIFTFGSLPLQAYALNGVYDPDFYPGNGIYYYNPGAGNTCSTTPAAATSLQLPTLTGSTNEEQIWNFLTSSAAGLSPEQAAGIMGNISQESSFKPDALQPDQTPDKTGYGIVQWTGTRRTQLEDAAKTAGVPVSTLAFQLAYLVQESQSRQVSTATAKLGFGKANDNEWSTLKTIKTADDAAFFWHSNFEVSADTKDQIQERITDAITVLAQYSASTTKANTAPLANAALNAACSFAGGDLAQTLLAYAWPDYHEGSYPLSPAAKPAYVAAVKKAMAAGMFVGGAPDVPGDPDVGMAGIDCGGFVSLLMVNSGFEPHYNYDDTQSKGAGNQVQQEAWAAANWTYLGDGGSIDANTLQPGDVAYTDGHTFVYVGDVQGFNSKYASASYSDSGATPGDYEHNGVFWRAPMAAYESATLTGYKWYGKRSAALTGSTQTDTRAP